MNRARKTFQRTTKRKYVFRETTVGHVARDKNAETRNRARSIVCVADAQPRVSIS